MTCNEFSNTFDVLLNSYRTLNKLTEGNIPNTINLNEYEKSVFLTAAQEDLIMSVYDGKGIYLSSFEGTEKFRKYLNELIKTIEITGFESGTGVSPNSKFVTLPEAEDKIWFITYEAATINDANAGSSNNKTILVKPVTQDDYYYIQQNPFKQANKNRVLRLDVNENRVELVSPYTLSKYIVRYVSKPSPIILIDFTNDGLTISGLSEKTECVLNPAIHMAILDRAVQMAYQSRATKSNE